METAKYKKLNLVVNLSLISLMVILLIVSFFLHSERWTVYTIGIIDRSLLGVWCIYNGVWNACTDYYTMFKSKGKGKSGKARWWIVFSVGIVAIVTAFMGYGFNGVSKPL